MKGLHSLVQPYRYGWAPYLTSELTETNRDMHGSLLDRWSEDGKVFGLWRWDRGQGANGNVYIVYASDDRYYFQYDDTTYHKEYLNVTQTTRENFNEQLLDRLEWWVGYEYVTKQEDRTERPTILGAPELTQDQILALPMPPGFNENCQIGDHDWRTEDGYTYCNDCGLER